MATEDRKNRDKTENICVSVGEGESGMFRENSIET